jgi:hypothetical protein
MASAAEMARINVTFPGKPAYFGFYVNPICPVPIKTACLGPLFRAKPRNLLLFSHRTPPINAWKHNP